MRALLLVIAFTLSAATAAAGGGAERAAQAPDGSGEPVAPETLRLGFTLFPYDVTEDAVAQTRAFALEHGNTVLFHHDSGVPWAEALADGPYPAGTEGVWRAERALVPVGHTVVLAITPTAADRRSLAPGLEAGGETGPVPPALHGRPFDDALVRRAYLNHARRMVRIYRPDFLVIGIELTEAARSGGADWRALSRLLREVRRGLKADHPGLPVGVEHVVQFLMLDAVAEAVRPTLADFDYLGLSLYTYGDQLGVWMGYPALPPPPAEWTEPLAWVREFVGPGYPLAVHETGYSSADVTLDVSSDPDQRVDEVLPGAPGLQARFLEDLLAWARRERAHYVVNFVPIDYPQLLESVPSWPEAGRVWMFTGLLDRFLRPKPALAIWDAALSRQLDPEDE